MTSGRTTRNARVEGVENVDRTKIRSVKRDLFDKAAWDQLLGNTPAVRQNVADLEMQYADVAAGVRGSVQPSVP